MTTPHPAEAILLADTTAAALGIRLIDAGTGRARLRMTITETMLNGHGTAHGGYLFLLADTAFACACNSHGPATVAAAADIDFIAPARHGDELEAVAVERVVFGRSGVYDVTVRRGDTVIAEFRGRSRRLRSGDPDESGTG